MKRLSGAAAVAAIAVLAAAYLGLFVRYGADPAWSVRTAWIGILPGFVAVLALAALSLTAMARVILSAGGLVLSYALARTGAKRLAASFGEDALAAQMWYLGWIGTAAAAVLVLSVLFTLATPSGDAE